LVLVYRSTFSIVLDHACSQQHLKPMSVAPTLLNINVQPN
jgi:hypothetical protein